MQEFHLINFVALSLSKGPCQNLTCFPPDVKCYGFCDQGVVTVPLMCNENIKRQPADFLQLEKAYSEFASQFINDAVQNNHPFFLYYPSHVSQNYNLNQIIFVMFYAVGCMSLKEFEKASG